MRHPIAERLAAAALLLLLPAGAAFAAPSPDRIRIHVADEDGEKLDLRIESGWIGALASMVGIECEASGDSRTLRMARRLDRGGEGTSYRFRDHDGDEVLAVRRHGKLRIETRDAHDGDTAVVEMPWKVAECFLLGREPEGGIAAFISDEGFDLRVDSGDGYGRVHVHID